MFSICRSLSGNRSYKPYVMPVILYTDGASPDFRRNLSIKPIVVSCGNYVGSVVRSMAGKRCVGYWPKIPVRFFLLCVFFMYLSTLL